MNGQIDIFGNVVTPEKIPLKVGKFATREEAEKRLKELQE